MPDRFYKIRNKDTGLFSTGGQYPKWTTKGKVWNSKGTVKQHLQMHQENEDRMARYCNMNYHPSNAQYLDHYYKDKGPGVNIGIRNNWEVVEYEFNPAEVASYDAREFYGQ